MTTPRPVSSRHKRLVTEASDMQTPPKRLVQLSKYRYREVRLAVACNPAAPGEALRGLLAEFTSEVTGNMGWSLAALVDPSLGKHTHGPMARDSSDPRVLLELARVGDEEVKRLVALNPAAPAEALALLGQDETIWKQGYGKNVVMMWHLSAHRRTPPELLAKLAGEPETITHRHLRMNPSTPREVLQRLVDMVPVEHRESIYSDVIENPAAPGELLAEAAAFASLRSRVAAHQRTPGETLASLAQDEDAQVRRHVASNPATPPAVLDVLARSRSEALRLRVAKNPSCGAATRQRLAGDTQATVRVAASRPQAR